MKIFDPKLTGSIEFQNPVAGNIEITGDLVVPGSITAREFKTELVSASIIYESGSTQFGNSVDDVHEFTGTIRIDRGADRKLQFSDPRGGKVWSVEHDTSQIYFWNATDSESPLSLQNDGDVIMNAGNVGIGTTSPNYKLVVSNGGAEGIEFGAGYLSGANLWQNFNRALGTYVKEVHYGSEYQFLTGNVGIGTTSPAVKLDVAGQIRSYASTGQIYAYSTDGGNDATVFAGWTAGTGIQMKYNPNSAIAYIENNYPITAGQPFGDIHFRQNLGGTLTTRLMIKADGGNVGIGTTNPIGNLEINTTSVRTSVNGGADELVIQNDGYSGITILSSATTAGQIHFGDVNQTNTGMIQYFHSDNSMRFATGDAGEKVRINSAGNLGIGTTSPISKLHIDGELTNSANASQVFINNTTTGEPAVIALRSVADNGGLGNTGAIYFDAGADGAAHNNLIAFNADHQTDTNYDVVINGNGNVGIGEVDPGHNLDIKGSSTYLVNINNTATDARLQFERNGTAYGHMSAGANLFTMYGNPGTSLRFMPGGSTAMYVNTNGSVGIGTTSPATRLEVTEADNSKIHVRQSDAAANGKYAQVILTHGTGYFDANSRSYQIQADGVSGTKASLRFQYWDGASYNPRMLINYDGYVGIGTITPASPLHIKTFTDTGVNHGLIIERSANTDKGYINYQGGGFQFRATDGDPLVLGHVSNERFRITPDGYIGIGTTGPSQSIHTTGGIRTRHMDTTTYNSLTGNAGGWYPIAQISDASSSPSIFFVRTYAHSSISFMVSRGYAVNNFAHIQILDHVYGANSGFANVSGVRIRQNGLVELKLEWSSGPSVSIEVKTIGAYAASLDGALAESTDTSPVIDTVNVSGNYGMMRSAGNLLVRGNAGLGSTSPEAKAHISSDNSGRKVLLESTNTTYASDAGPELHFKIKQSNDQAATAGYIRGFSANGWAGGLLVHTHNPGSPDDNTTERLRIDSDGLKFNGDTAAANALDDYEEGTFTPTIGDGTYTYTYRRGHYQKIGNTVHIHIGFKINTASPGTATARIDGLPFLGTNWGAYQEPHERVAVAGLCATANLSYNLSFYISNNSGTLYGRTSANNADTAVDSNEVWQNGTFIKLQMSYTVS